MGEYQVLNSIDAIRTRPGMYIGSTENPSHLCHEVLDNAIDEIANKFANRVEIFFNQKDDSIWVSDNGRGLYSYNMEMEDGSFRDSINVLFTETHSGSKFDLKDYETLIGMNGVGLVAINALSEWVSVRIRDRDNKDKVYSYFFKNSELISKKEEINSNYNYSTVVGFKPNKKYFETINFDKKIFAERLILSKSKFTTSTFILNNQTIPNISIEDYIKSKLELDKSIKLFKLKYEKANNYNIEVFLTYKNSTVINVAGDVNLRDCLGTFISSFQTELKKIIKTKVNKKFQKLNDKEFLSGLNLYISLTIPEPKFDSQTKVRMVSNIKKPLIDPLISQIKWFVSQPEVLKIIEDNLNRKFQNSLIKTNVTRSKRVSVGNKLRDCIYTPGNILYIVEGDSAGGTVNIIRDKKREACFPLKGKILNVETHSLEKIKSNKEVQDLLEALGPSNKRRYNHIKVLCDADSICAETPIVFINNEDLIECKQIQHIDRNEIKQIISLNKDTGKSEIKPVLDVIQHEYQKDFIYRIKCYGNHYIDCTNDHVVYVYNTVTCDIEELSPLNINPSIHELICCEKFPTMNKNISIDVSDQIIECIKKNNKKNVFNITVDINHFNYDCSDAKIDIEHRIDYSVIGRVELSKKININSSTLQMYDTGRDHTKTPISVVEKILDHVNIDLTSTTVNVPLNESTKHYLKIGELSNRGRKNITTIFDITKELAYIIGHYIGDGNWGSSKNNPYCIHINAGPHENNIRNIVYCCKKLNFNYVLDTTNKISQNNTIIIIKAIELCALLNYFGLNNKTHHNKKFIPNEFFSCKPEVRMFLLRGLYESDGSFFKPRPTAYRLNYATTSCKLKDDLVVMLKQFACIPSVSIKKPTKAYKNKRGQQIISRVPSYSININYKEDLLKLTELFKYHPKFDGFYKSGKNPTCKFTSVGPNTISIPIKEVQKIKYNYDVVYDLSVKDNNNFATGTIGGILHNSDGLHISVLVLLFFQKFAPDLIQDNKISVILPPLYGATKNKNYVPIYDQKYILYYKQQGYNITRFKGLGEMNPNQLKVCLNSNMEHIVKFPKDQKTLDQIISIITDKNVKRAIMNDNRCQYNRILNHVIDRNNQSLNK